MIYIALLILAVVSFSVGTRSVDAGLSVAIVGTALCFLTRTWFRWEERQSAEAWKRRSKELQQERERNICIEMERTRVHVITDESLAPLAFVAHDDAVAASETEHYSVVHAGDFFFLVSRISVEVDAEPVRNYIELRYNTRAIENSLKPIHLFQPSAQSVFAKQERERKIRVEHDRILSARLADVETRRATDLGDASCCLYIMASIAAIKIGVSNRPEDRLKQVQTGHPAKLRLYKIWWFQSTAEATLLERTVHGQLKVRGSHSSGEWFNISKQDAVSVVSEAIKHLSGAGEIDKGLHALIESPLTNLELSLGRLLNQKWNISKKGNEYLRLPENTITVFRRKRGWSYVHNEEFSQEQYATKEAAKSAALQQVFKSVQPPHCSESTFVGETDV